MTFAYKRRRIAPNPLVDGDVVHRPMVPIHVITYPDITFLWALADTGADHTLLPASLTERGRLDESTAVTAFGGQQVAVQPGHVDFTLSDGRQRYTWSTVVGFVDFEKPEDEVAILGHLGFFEFFTATFDSTGQELTLHPTPKLPAV